jgi:hypothetical protein
MRLWHTHPEYMLEVVLGEEQVHGALSETAAAAWRHAEATPAHAEEHGIVSARSGCVDDRNHVLLVIKIVAAFTRLHVISTMKWIPREALWFTKQQD